jgi:hypothetical protein
MMMIYCNFFSNDRVDINLTYENLKSFIPTCAVIYLTREGNKNDD